MEVRNVERREDVAGVIRVRGLGWREAYADILPAEILQQQTVEPSEAEIDRWSDRLLANRSEVLVAVDDDATVRGFADFRWGDRRTKGFVSDGEAGLRAIYVHPDHWGEGIGTTLLERGVESLPAEVDVVRLEMLSGNEVGRRFYRARGFERTDTATREIGGTRYPTGIYTLHV